jgi:hypothetical protein
LNIAKQGEHSYPPDTSHRVEHFTALLEHSGGRLCKMDWRFGDYDLVALMEYSNTEAPPRWRNGSAPLPPLCPNRNDADCQHTCAAAGGLDEG